MTQLIHSSTFRQNMKTVLDQVESKPDKIFILKRNNNISSVLIHPDFLEELLDSHDHRYLVDIKKAREQVKKGETYSFNDIFGEIV